MFRSWLGSHFQHVGGNAIIRNKLDDLLQLTFRGVRVTVSQVMVGQQEPRCAVLRILLDEVFKGSQLNGICWDRRVQAAQCCPIPSGTDSQDRMNRGGRLLIVGFRKQNERPKFMNDRIIRALGQALVGQIECRIVIRLLEGGDRVIQELITGRRTGAGRGHNRGIVCNGNRLCVTVRAVGPVAAIVVGVVVSQVSTVIGERPQTPGPQSPAQRTIAVSTISPPAVSQAISQTVPSITAIAISETRREPQAKTGTIATVSAIPAIPISTVKAMVGICGSIVIVRQVDGAIAQVDRVSSQRLIGDPCASPCIHMCTVNSSARVGPHSDSRIGSRMNAGSRIKSCTHSWANCGASPGIDACTCIRSNIHPCIGSDTDPRVWGNMNSRIGSNVNWIDRTRTQLAPNAGLGEGWRANGSPGGWHMDAAPDVGNAAPTADVDTPATSTNVNAAAPATAYMNTTTTATTMSAAAGTASEHDARTKHDSHSVCDQYSVE